MSICSRQSVADFVLESKVSDQQRLDGHRSLQAYISFPSREYPRKLGAIEECSDVSLVSQSYSNQTRFRRTILHLNLQLLLRWQVKESFALLYHILLQLPVDACVLYVQKADFQ